ncbi:MAG: LytTR family transcriptional regulator [Oscillospiraceae bacterium]|nr:LytTR family transcriptional regulator [Oscillospiraceae bacterium]MBQ4311724.1 LytTR family transcriptional regulator [Oscillospiraceae bacterium]
MHRIESMNVSLPGRTEGSTVSIDIAELYYIENVERRVFLYTRNDVYRYDGTMADIEKAAADTALVRISRTCIMNTMHLREIRQIRNSHLEAMLDNDEKLIVSRKYLQDIKKVFRRERI